MALGNTLPVGTLIDDTWRVDLPLGGGGMGSVYACTHVRNGLRVALKLLHAHAAKDPALRARFLVEGRALNRVQHPGVVRALGDGVLGDSPYLLMELVLGRSLKEVATSLGGAMTPDALRTVIDGLLDALSAVHQAGIIHRDVKPDNVIVTHEGRIKLVDFGIARVDAIAGETSTGSVLGTVAYMAPEQVMGKSGRVDARADLFAVGALLFKLLTGKHVHHELSGLELLLAMGTQQAPSLRTVLPTGPTALVAFVDRALAFERERRFQTAHEMRQAWNALWDGGVVLETTRQRRWPMWTFPLLGIVIAALAITSALLFSGLEPERKTKRKSKSRETATATAATPARTSDRSQAPPPRTTSAPAGAGLCGRNLDELRSLLAKHESDRIQVVVLKQDVASVTAIDPTGAAVATTCVSGIACMRGRSEAKDDGKGFAQSSIPWQTFRSRCEAAEAAFAKEHKLKGEAEHALFGDSVGTLAWMFDIESGRISELYCFTPDGRAVSCAAVE